MHFLGNISMKDYLLCPHCGGRVLRYRNPFPTVDIIINLEAIGGEGDLGIVLIQRKNPPLGWAIPGGFVDYGESLETAAKREAREETGLSVQLLYQLGAYSDPTRDPRHHTLSVVFVAKAAGTPRAASDASHLGVFDPRHPPSPLAFDHQQILRDYLERCLPGN